MTSQQLENKTGIKAFDLRFQDYKKKTMCNLSLFVYELGNYIYNKNKFSTAPWADPLNFRKLNSLFLFLKITIFLKKSGRRTRQTVNYFLK